MPEVWVPSGAVSVPVCNREGELPIVRSGLRNRGFRQSVQADVGSSRHALSGGYLVFIFGKLPIENNRNGCIMVISKIIWSEGRVC